MDTNTALKMLLAQALALLGGASDGGADDDPMTAVLDQRGVWRPSWLRAANAQIEATYPGLYKPGASIGPDGQPTTRTAIRLIDGFLYQPIKQRDDLTQVQRDNLQKAHNDTFLGATTGDFGGRTLAYMPFDDVIDPSKPGYFVASLHQFHDTPESVREATLRLYRIHGLLP